jgi:WD40 repeat protein
MHGRRPPSRASSSFPGPEPPRDPCPEALDTIRAAVRLSSHVIERDPRQFASQMWDIETGRELQTLADHSNWVTAVALTPDGKRAVSASYDETLKVWDLETGEVVAAFTADAPLISCAVGPDGRAIVAGDASGRVHFLSLVLNEHS